jgi:hypothetical protein
MTYTIDARSGPNGSLSPNSMQVIEHGQSQTFTITPNAGYTVADVLVDGSSHGPTSTYTFADVQRDHTLTVTFAPLSAAMGPGEKPTTPAKSPSPVSLNRSTSGAPPFNWSGLVGLIAGIIGAAAMGSVLFLRIRERKASPRPEQPMFTVKDLEISPKELRIGNKGAIAVTVTNQGHHAGTYRVTLKIDGITRGTKDITLARNTSDRVEFSVPATAPGAFVVNVGDLTGTLTVVAGALEPPAAISPQTDFAQSAHSS